MKYKRSQIQGTHCVPYFSKSKNNSIIHMEVNMTNPKYKRVVLKLSGEALAGDQGFGINPSVIKSVAAQVKEVAELGVEVAVVVGGGNIWRGKIGEEWEWIVQLLIIWECWQQ